jgi:CHAT domain-containing protein
LTRPFGKHLDSDELDDLVSLQTASVTDLGRHQAQTLEEAKRHLESCPECGQRVQMHKCVQGEIDQLGTSSYVPEGPDCDVNVDWLEVAGGLLSEMRTRDLIKHAAQCGHCGPLLREAAETLSDEVTSNEEELLAALGSARSEGWHRNLAKTLGGDIQDCRVHEKSDSRWRGFFLWPRLAFVVAALGAIVVAGWIGFRVLRPPSVDQLLAQAYTDRRTLEVRIPGAKFAPIRVERGTNGSNIDKPPALLKAEALIGENLSKSPNDPKWLDAKARADLLDGNYESAIQSLQRALEDQPDSPELHTDLGAAYFLSAKSADRTVDYGNAIESLSKALANSPNDTIALYNRALACEAIFLYTQAIDDWEHYLRVDPQGEWADEARKHLAAVKQKLEQREKSLAEPLLTPEEITSASAEDGVLQERIDGRIEEYLTLAVTTWLPRAFSESTPGQSRETEFALDALAAIAREQHNDSWLTDLLRHTTGTQFHAAIKALAVSVVANEHGDYADGQDSAHTAAKLFRVAANSAGELRAQAEEVYSDHLLWEGERCMSLLRSLARPLSDNSYTWLEAQMSLEESNCADLVGDLGTYQTAIGRGIHEAEANKYNALLLRGLGFQAQAAASLGDANTGFSLASEGLALFWASQVDIMKGYNLYTDLDTAADDLRLVDFQVALWRESTTLIDRHPNVLQRAMAHRWYAYAAYLANMPALATSEFSEASALFAASPQTAATARDRMDAEIWLATIETRQGDIKLAAARLKDVKPTLESTPSFDPEIGFYTVESDIGIRQGDSASTESALRSAIFLAEWALNSFPAEGDRRKWTEQTRSAYRNAVKWKILMGDSTSALELWEWYRGAELRASEHTFSHPLEGLDTAKPPDLSQAPPLPAPTEVANRLPLMHDQTAIVYGTFPDGIVVWIYDDRGISYQWISTQLSQVQDLATRFRRLCSDPQSDPSTLRIAGHSLYDLLIAPVESRLVPGRTLLIEPDDFLTSIPWGALVDSRSHYLVERAALVVTPGLYREIRLRPAVAINSETPALIVSVPAADEAGLTPLSDAEEEARAVSGRFSSAHWLQNNNATLSAVQSEIRSVGVFHFAGHAVSSPARSGLVLAELDFSAHHARLIDAESISSKQPERMQLAVLSACNTGSEVQTLGSGTETLVQAFLQAGVPHVVASLWNVDSSETTEFMKQFYVRLTTGNDTASSMRFAQLALASNAVSAHPYYWAAFQLHGAK